MNLNFISQGGTYGGCCYCPYYSSCNSYYKSAECVFQDDSLFKRLLEKFKKLVYNNM